MAGRWSPTHRNVTLSKHETAAVAQLVENSPGMRGSVLKSLLQQTYVIKTDSDNFSAKRSATGVSVTADPWRFSYRRISRVRVDVTVGR